MTRRDRKHRIFREPLSFYTDVIRVISIGVLSFKLVQGPPDALPALLGLTMVLKVPKGYNILCTVSAALAYAQ